MLSGLFFGHDLVFCHDLCAEINHLLQSGGGVGEGTLLVAVDAVFFREASVFQGSEEFGLLHGHTAALAEGGKGFFHDGSHPFFSSLLKNRGTYGKREFPLRNNTRF